MLKKIVLGALLLAVIAILAVGAIIRTNDKVVGASNGRGQGRGANNPAIAGQFTPIEWITVEGTVISVDDIAMTVKTPSGEQVLVEGRPWSYALEQKFVATVGDQIKVKGFSESGYLTAAQLQNLTNGKTVQLRDANGRPGWSGRGRGGG